MAYSPAVSTLGNEFDAFLFAPVGESRNGMVVSVVSALACLDVDPWAEAASLARLPRDAATRRLTALIASLPERPFPNLDLGTIAAGLIARLPSAAVPPLKQAVPARFVATPTALFYISLIVALFVTQIIIGIERPPDSAAPSPAKLSQAKVTSSPVPPPGGAR
jgi:hypothetical protein